MTDSDGTNRPWYPKIQCGGTKRTLSGDVRNVFRDEGICILVKLSLEKIEISVHPFKTLNDTCFQNHNRKELCV